MNLQKHANFAMNNRMCKNNKRETEFEQRYPGTGGLLQHPMWDNEEDDYRFNVGMDNHREQLILASG